uniref:Peptidase aspartic putative domain-containing protein n=1 Tax=Acrobeloides nanus TaxID=290746 RepID=A0A914CWB0_9BILA
MYAIPLIQKDGKIKVVQAFALEKLTNFIKIIPVPKEIRKEVLETSELKVEIASPDLMIGMRHFWDIVRPERTIKLENGYRVVDSTVGPIICGQAKRKREGMTYVVTKADIDKDEDKSALEQMWTLEGIGIKDNPAVNDDDIALQKFMKTIRWNGDSVNCDPIGGNKSTVVYLDKAEIDEECELLCPASTSRSRAKAQLHFVPIKTEERSSNYQDSQKSFGGLDLWALAKFFFTDYTNILFFIEMEGFWLQPNLFALPMPPSYRRYRCQFSYSEENLSETTIRRKCIISAPKEMIYGKGAEEKLRFLVYTAISDMKGEEVPCQFRRGYMYKLVISNLMLDQAMDFIFHSRTVMGPTMDKKILAYNLFQVRPAFTSIHTSKVDFEIYFDMVNRLPTKLERDADEESPVSPIQLYVIRDETAPQSKKRRDE